MTELKQEQTTVSIISSHESDRQINKESVYKLLDTIMERYQLIKIEVIDFKSIDETESQLTFTILPNLNSKFSKITTVQAFLEAVQTLFAFTSELDTIEDYWEKQQPKTVGEAWKLVADCLSEEVYDWIENSWNG
nr:hypothetical protein [Streptococcus gallolyticus]